MIEMVKAGLIAASFGAVMSFLFTYFFAPVPDSEFLHGLFNAISGLMSGFFGAFMSLLMHKRKS
jgi:ABC-type multidrug transport system permease subunit